MKTNDIQVTKASGEKVIFSVDKLKHSLERSGANDDLANRIIKAVRSQLYEGISTSEIYTLAFKLLKKHSHPSAARYKLKRAILELGPSGYPFERYIGEILHFMGYMIQVGVTVEGACVSHEVDVVAEKENKHFMVECKFHNRQHHHCDVKVPLYIHSRFLDVQKKWRTLPHHDGKFHQGWIFTNTRFTEDAIKYGKCAGLVLISWDYPARGSLKERIDLSGLYPLTCLTTLTKYEKGLILQEDVVLTTDIAENPGLLRKINISEKRIPKILEEAKDLTMGYSI